MPTRYASALIVLHWILATLICVALVMGGVFLANAPNDADKIDGLRAHMIAGMVIGILTLVRLVVRRRSAKPAPATTGNALLDKLSHLAHYGLYALTLLVVASGVGISVMAGLPDVVFAGNIAALPESFAQFPPRAAHGILTKLLLIFVILHVLGALYHQFILKDGLFRRMWLGSRSK